MKKIILTLAIALLVLPAGAFSEASMCAPAPTGAAKTVGNFFSNITGTNFLVTKAAEIAIQNSLKKELTSKFNVQLKAFGGKSFIDGQFRSISLESKRINSSDINATNFSAKSICEYNQIKLVKDEVYFLENFLMDFSTKITDDDLKKTIASPVYRKMVRDMNLSIGPVTLFKLYDPTVEIKNNRLHMSAKTDIVGLLKTNTQILKMDAGLAVVDEKIVFSNIGFYDKNISLSSILPIVNRMNPFVNKVKINSSDYATIKIKNVKIENNAIVADGLVVIPKSLNVPN